MFEEAFHAKLLEILELEHFNLDRRDGSGLGRNVAIIRVSRQALGIPVETEVVGVGVERTLTVLEDLLEVLFDLDLGWGGGLAGVGDHYWGASGDECGGGLVGMGEIKCEGLVQVDGGVLGLEFLGLVLFL